MKIYTIVMTKESFSNAPVVECLGSYVDGFRARESMIEKIIYMANGDNDFSFAMWNDENHDDVQIELGEKFSNAFVRSCNEGFHNLQTWAALKNYLEQNIPYEEISYHVYCSTADARDATYRFDVMKNDLEEA